MGSDIGNRVPLIKTMLQGIEQELSIQGSSLKGYIRSVYEAITNSTLAVITSKYREKIQSERFPCSERQAEIAQVTDSHDFTISQILDATVTAIKGNKVTYEILGTIKLTEKEPKKAQLLSEGQTVKVEIVDLKEDGSIKKIKCAG